MTNWEFSLDCAKKLDENDGLRSYRDHFHIPNFSGKESIYFTGNSLGLQPKSVQSYIQKELDDWSKWGVEGHENAENPWISYHEIFIEDIKLLVGAKEKEEKPELEIIKSLIKELSDKEDDPMQVDVTDTDVTVTKGESKVTASKKK